MKLFSSVAHSNDWDEAQSIVIDITPDDARILLELREKVLEFWKPLGGFAYKGMHFAWDGVDVYGERLNELPWALADESKLPEDAVLRSEMDAVVFHDGGTIRFRAMDKHGPGVVETEDFPLELLQSIALQSL